jgi:tetrapyrrole methylase family protein/MazG family protein
MLSMQTPKAFGRLCDIVEKLRGEGGCPWDREQTPQTLRGDLIEETYECIEAIDEKEPGHIREELGDLFLLVTMVSYMHEQSGAFTINEVLEGIAEKLIRRHPHVFGSQADTPEGLKGNLEDANSSGTESGGGDPISSEQVLENWARIKIEQEGRKPKDSVLDEVSRSLPPLDRAWKLQKKAAKCGFDWPSIDGVLDKIREELAETEVEIAAQHKQASTTQAAGAAEQASATQAASAGVTQQADGAAQAAGTASALEAELGDLLFSVVNLCRFLKVEPSVALQRTNVKFEKRFKHVEKRMKEKGLAMDSGHLEQMDRFWNEAKQVL